MLSYVIKRLLALVITLFLIVSVCFFAIRLIPGAVSAEDALYPELKEAMMRRYNLHLPLFDQYVIFIKNFFTFDFGESIMLYPRLPVFDVIKQRLPLTLQLNVYSLLITVPVGMILGTIAALKKNTIIDNSISLLVVLFISVPSFIFGSLMQYIFSFKLKWLPFLINLQGSMWSLKTFKSMILPILALSFGGIAIITRYLRAELFEALNSDYMLLSKAKGLSQARATAKHAIKNSFIPLCNIIVPMFTGLLSGSLVVENIFGIPGMGSVLSRSIAAADYYLTIATLFFYSIIGLTTYLLVDLSYGVIDPRIRIGGGKTNE